MKIFKHLQRAWNLPWICFLMGGYGFYLRVIQRAHRGLVGDELVQYDALASQDSFAFWRRVAAYGDHTSFPGEFLLNYPFVKMFGMNKWLVSIPHITLNIVGFFLFYKLCRRFLQTKTAVIIAFVIYSFNFNLVYYAFEFRPYAVLHVLAMASLYCFCLLAERYNKISTIQKVWIAILLILIFMYHAYGLIIALLPLFYVLVGAWQKKTLFSFQEKWYLGVVVGIGIVLWGWYSSYSFFGLKPNDAQALTQTFEYIADPAKDIVGFLRGVIGNLLGGKIFYILLLGVVAAFVMPLSAKDFMALACFFIFLVFLPIALILTMDIKNQYWFIQRQFIWVVPFWALFIGQCWDQVLLRRQRQST
ncbi:MAG: glycosyltransferase family 39 protein [Candidatus Omnitrophota bacterium]|nr:glycosyltransferase family 39 protein [Candidatus Omnitrophota bacterium]